MLTLEQHLRVEKFRRWLDSSMLKYPIFWSTDKVKLNVEKIIREDNSFYFWIKEENIIN